MTASARAIVDTPDMVHRSAQAASPVIIQPGIVPTSPHEGEAVTDAGVTDDGCPGHSGDVNQSISEGMTREEASGTAREAPSTGCGTSDESQNVGIQSAPPQNKINAQDRAAAPPKERHRRRSRNGDAGQGAKAPTDPGLTAETALPEPATSHASRAQGAGSPSSNPGGEVS